MMKLVYIAAGGAIGAVARYAVGGVALRLMGEGFAWGTLCVNLVGALLIGVLAGIADVTTMSPNARVFAMIGLLGAFTTFSTFSLETVAMLRDRQYVLAGTNLAVSCILGVAAVFLGLFAVRYFVAAMK